MTHCACQKARMNWENFPETKLKWHLVKTVYGPSPHFKGKRTIYVYLF